MHPDRYVISLEGSGTWNSVTGRTAPDAVADFVRRRADQARDIWYGVSTPAADDGIMVLTFLAAPSVRDSSVDIQRVEIVEVRITPPEVPGYTVEVV